MTISESTDGHAPAALSRGALGAAPSGGLSRLLGRSDARVFDLLDVAAADAMLGSVGLPPLTASVAGDGVVRLVATPRQCAALAAIAEAASPEGLEAWLLTLAPRLNSGVVQAVGPEWQAEVDVSVDLALAVRSGDTVDLAEQLFDGPVLVAGTRSAVDVLAHHFPDPELVTLL